MQISPIAAFKSINFAGSPHTDPSTGISYDEGQPYTRQELQEDTFVRRGRADKKPSRSEAQTQTHKLSVDATEKEKMEARVPGYRPEDLLY